MSLKTAGLAGTQAELCAVCHGERCQQGHVHQKYSGQRAQKQQVRFVVMFHRSATEHLASMSSVLTLVLLNYTGSGNMELMAVGSEKM